MWYLFFFGLPLAALRTASPIEGCNSIALISNHSNIFVASGVWCGPFFCFQAYLVLSSSLDSTMCAAVQSVSTGLQVTGSWLIYYGFFQLEHLLHLPNFHLISWQIQTELIFRLFLLGFNLILDEMIHILTFFVAVWMYAFWFNISSLSLSFLSMFRCGIFFWERKCYS